MLGPEAVEQLLTGGVGVGSGWAAAQRGGAIVAGTVGWGARRAVPASRRQWGFLTLTQGKDSLGTPNWSPRKFKSSGNY